MAVFSNTVDKLKDQNQVVIKDQDKPIEVVMVDRKQTSADKEEQNEAARAEKIATSKFGANSYQSAQAYNRKVEIQEQQDVLKAQQIQATKDLKDAQMRSTLALAKFQRQIGRDNKDDAAKIGEIKRKIEDKVRKKPGDFGLDYTSRSLIGFDENKEKDPDLKARIIAAKKKFNDIVAKKILEDDYSEIVTNNINTETLVKKKKQVRKKIIYVNS